MNSPARPSEIPLSETSQAARGAVPQHYTTDIERLGEATGLLAEVIRQARRHFGEHTSLALDSQVLNLHPGAFPGLPVWRSAPDCGEMVVACLGDEPLMEIAPGQRLAVEDTADPLPDTLLASPTSAYLLPGRTPVRFRPATQNQLAVVLLVRPTEGLRIHNRPRLGARVFAQKSATTPRPDVPAWAETPDLEFDSCFRLHEALPPFTEADIAAEPVFGATPALAREVGGPIMQAFLDCLPAEWMHKDDVVVGAKRDELSPGWSPALLDWHTDGSSRTARRSDGMPDFHNPIHRQYQYVACVGQASPMGLLPGTIRLPDPPLGLDWPERNAAWKTLTYRHIADGRARPTTAPPGRVFSYGLGGFHTATASKVPGWRLFLKAMDCRGGGPRNVVHWTERGTVAWPHDGPTWPTGAFGVFPEELP